MISYLFLDFLALLLSANVTEIWDKERGMGLRHDPSQIWPDQSVKCKMTVKCTI